jgi:epoxyqueuosine reductase
MSEELFSQWEEWGYDGRVVAIQHLGDLQEEIEGRYRQGLFDEEFYQEWLTRFAFSPPDSLPEARSIIVVAVPQPQTRVTFTWACPEPCPEHSRRGSRRDGEPVQFIIPPTYFEQKTENRVRELLARVLEPAGYRVAEAVLPKKLLAVRSGLAAYGRNNISYVPGMGSFHGLVAVYSDLPAQADNWREPQMMESCQNCSACLRHCPVGAIPSASPLDPSTLRQGSGQAGLRAGSARDELRAGTSERFLLHAERCITFHNEKPGDVPFPAWMDPSWHNCLIGCMHCQRICPQNKEFLHWVEERVEFSQEETALLLQGVALDQLPLAMAKKLEQSDVVELLDVLPRNLSVLLKYVR